MMKDLNAARVKRQSLRSLAVVALLAVCMMFGTVLAGNKSEGTKDNSIVGFWHAELHYADGSLWYQSIQQYHADGLEMEDAATPPLNPAHVCMGVWKQQADSVKMYHIIWMYDGNDGPPVNYAVLTEANKLNADGNSLSGTFDVKIYDIRKGNMVKEVKGTTIARRIDFQHPFSLFSK